VIVVFILIHLQLFTSILGPGYKISLEWTSVSERMNSWFYDATYIVLLFAVLTHGFIGIRNILFEYITNRKYRIIISWTLIIIYLILLSYGFAPIFASSI
jgi:succinate dehydrogenase hydrophobic anchor subunit